MADLYSVAGDTRRQFATLTDDAGVPLNLEGMTARLRVSEATSGRRLRYDKLAAVQQAGPSGGPYTDKGVVYYDPATADVAQAGDFLFQFYLTDGQAKIRTVPESGAGTWRISPKLA